MDNSHDMLVTASKAAPSVIMAAWSFWGFTLQEWAAISAIIYTLLMTFFLLKDRYRKWKKERKR